MSSEDPLPEIAIDPNGLPQEILAAAEAPEGLWLEIGFGGGEHLAWQAEANPERLLIGAEYFVKGLAKILGQIEIRGLTNIRLYQGDVRDLLEALPAKSLSRVFLLFPDPWPKKRHHKRRLVTAVFLDELARCLRPGGTFRLASDDAGYLRWMLFELQRHPAFCWQVQGPANWRRRPADWPPTRYEEKALAAGRCPAYLSYERLPE
jgi:tRNA (guanine-N7-)-methyltransferase